MQTANVMVALGGSKNNTVPKFGVTAAEIAVLMLVHGDESITEIEPAEEIERTSKEERSRLEAIYGTHDGDRFVSRAVNALFPGAAARLYENLAELDLNETLFKATSRMTASAAPPAKAKGKAAKVVAPAPVEDAAEATVSAQDRLFE